MSEKMRGKIRRALDRAFKKQKHSSVAGTASPTTAPESPGSIRWSRGVSLASILIGGISLIQISFWWSAVLIYAGLLLLGLDIYHESWFRVSRLRIVPAIGVILLVLILFSVQVVLAHAPIELSAVTSIDDYPAGTTIDNVEWVDAFSELEITLRNETNEDFTDLDVSIKPDIAITAIEQEHGDVAGVTIGSTISSTTVTQDLLYLGSKQRIANPLVMIASTCGYRIRCDRLPRNSTIRVKMFLATPLPFKKRVDDPQSNYGVFDDTYVLREDFGSARSKWFAHSNHSDVLGKVLERPRKAASTVIIDGRYIAVLRERYIHQTIVPQDYVEAMFH